jgi:hypothetical protein
MSKEVKQYLENDDFYQRMNYHERNSLEKMNSINNYPQRELSHPDNDLLNEEFKYSNIANNNHPNKIPQNFHYGEEIFYNPIPILASNRENLHTAGGIPNDYSARPNMNMSNNQNDELNAMYMNNIAKRPFSEKNPDREYKKRQQEEYRKALENQIREQNERKNRAKLESRGLEVKANNVSAIANNNNNNIPQHNNVTNVSNNAVPLTGNKILSEEALNERRKKLEYQNFLKQQIEDKKQRQVEEKRKRFDDDVRFNDMYPHKEENVKFQKKRVNINEEYNSNYQTTSPQVNTNVNSPSLKQDINVNIPQVSASNKKGDTFITSTNAVGNNNINNGLSQEYYNYRERLTRGELNTGINNNNLDPNNNNPFQSSYNNPNIFTPSNNNIANNNNNYHYRDLPPYYDDQHETFSNADPQVGNYNTGVNNNIMNNQYTQGFSNTNMQSPMFSQQGQQYMFPPFIQGMLQQFFVEQMKLINQYKGTIDKMNDERDKVLFQNIAAREKMLAMNQLKTEQEKIKNSLGFYPFDKNYTKKIEDMLNIIDHTAAESHRETFVKDDQMYQAINNNPKPIQNNIPQHIVDNRPIKAGRPEHHQDEGQYFNNISKLDYKSKYENDLSQSMMSLNEDIKKSLTGFSKFVCIGAGDDEKFLETWRENDFNNLNNNNINITEIPEDNIGNDVTLKDEDDEAHASSSYGHNYNLNSYYNYPVYDNKYNQRLIHNSQMDIDYNRLKLTHNNRAKSAAVIYNTNINQSGMTTNNAYNKGQLPTEFIKSQQGIKISAMEKDKSLYLEETERNDINDDIEFTEKESCNFDKENPDDYEYENSQFVAENEFGQINDTKEQAYYNRKSLI